MVIFRENTEDIYAGIEFEAGSAENAKFLALFRRSSSRRSTARSASRTSSGIGIKPVSREGTERLVRSAIEYAIANKRKSLTIVHKGNIMKFTEGAFRNWGYALAEKGVRRPDLHLGPVGTHQEPPRAKPRPTPSRRRRWPPARVLVKDAIADITLQQVLTRPEEFDVIATMNLNGDYLSDALAAQVGGIGIAPGGNINYVTGHAVFEATHGTAPKYANLDKVNPGSVILSGEMMLRYMGWTEAADLDHHGDGQDHRREDRHLRLRATDGRREGSEVQRVRRRLDPQHALSDPRAPECAAAIVAAFAHYNAEFRAITRRAPERFENRDWAGNPG